MTVGDYFAWLQAASILAMHCKTLLLSTGFCIDTCCGPCDNTPMKTEITTRDQFAEAIRNNDGPLPFLTGQEDLAKRWAEEGGGPTGLLSLLRAPDPVQLLGAGTVQPGIA